MCKFRPIFSILFSFGLPYSFSALTQLGDKKGIDLKKISHQLSSQVFFWGEVFLGDLVGPDLTWTGPRKTGRLTRWARGTIFFSYTYHYSILSSTRTIHSAASYCCQIGAAICQPTGKNYCVSRPRIKQNRNV